MEFREDIPIWRQIEAMIRQKILSGEWPEGERVPSVRELGGELAVNPITVMRAYEGLQQRGIVENRRGIGFFVAPQATEAVLQEERRRLLEEDAPAFVARMHTLGIGIEKLKEIYDHYENK
jgi:DNA-binding transcriptional regulator YhcF (GntR family)